MPRYLYAAALAAAVALGGCTSFDDKGSSSRSGLAEVGSDLGGSGFTRSSDTYGTGRRVDVYGGSNSPVLPTIGAPGYGK
ncbi:hypothetical protein [uncultured Enterovirga sp.]|uniref:hypothetical protein n=1 Tax=uncultured Enterovirga sp. TaxID=2026352 RepID=UPI0035CA156B